MYPALWPEWLMRLDTPAPRLSSPARFVVCFLDKAYECEYTGGFGRALHEACKLAPGRLHCAQFPNGRWVRADEDHHIYANVAVLQTFDVSGPDSLRYRPQGGRDPWTAVYAETPETPETPSVEPSEFNRSQSNEAYHRGFRDGVQDSDSYAAAYPEPGQLLEQYLMGVKRGKAFLGNYTRALRTELSKAVTEPSTDLLTLARQVTDAVNDARAKQGILAADLEAAEKTRAYSRGVSDGVSHMGVFTFTYPEGSPHHEEYKAGLACGAERRTQQQEEAPAHDVKVLRGELARTQDERDYFEGYAFAFAHKYKTTSAATPSYLCGYSDACALQPPVFRKA